MFSTIFFLAFWGFYLQYNLSQKVKIRNKPPYLAYMERHVLASRVGGIAAMLLAGLLMVLTLGFGAGLFGFGAVLMCVGYLVVALAPLGYLKHAYLLGVYAGITLIEVLFF